MRTRSQARAQPDFLTLLPPDVLEAITDRATLMALLILASTCKTIRAAAETRMNTLLALTMPPFNLTRRQIVSQEDLNLRVIGVNQLGLGLGIRLGIRSVLGDIGMKVFATAIGNGALPVLNKLIVTWNHIGDVGMKALAIVIGKGALEKLLHLNLSHNDIGVQGFTEFSSAISNRVLRQLTTFIINYNQIGDSGIKAFADAIGNGALPALSGLVVEEGPLGTHNPALITACFVRGVRLVNFPLSPDWMNY